MKKSLVILILLVAGASAALAHSLYQSLTQAEASNSSQRVSLATCQDFQASVRVGGVIKATSGKACQLADGSWRIYPAGQRSAAVANYHGYAGKAGSECQRGKYNSQTMQSKQLQKFLHDIHGWNNGQQKQLKPFNHPKIKPGQKYHKKLQKQQPLLVDLSDDSYRNWH